MVSILLVCLSSRSMVADADKKGLITVGGRDPELPVQVILPRGHKLVTELPQLINVLVGDSE
ncbi:MAG: hypothetical protein ACLR5N_09905 [Haemophilus parainfluenzae]